MTETRRYVVLNRMDYEGYYSAEIRHYATQAEFNAIRSVHINSIFAYADTLTEAQAKAAEANALPDYPRRTEENRFVRLQRELNQPLPSPRFLLIVVETGFGDHPQIYRYSTPAEREALCDNFLGHVRGDFDSYAEALDAMEKVQGQKPRMSWLDRLRVPRSDKPTPPAPQVG